MSTLTSTGTSTEMSTETPTAPQIAKPIGAPAPALNNGSLTKTACARLALRPPRKIANHAAIAAQANKLLSGGPALQAAPVHNPLPTTDRKARAAPQLHNVALLKPADRPLQHASSPPAPVQP